MRNDSNRLLKHKLHLQSCQTRRVDWCYRRADWCYTIMVNFECRPLPTIHSCIANSAYCLYILKGTVPHISFPRLSFQFSPVYRPRQSLLRNDTAPVTYVAPFTTKVIISYRGSATGDPDTSLPKAPYLVTCFLHWAALSFWPMCVKN